MLLSGGVAMVFLTQTRYDQLIRFMPQATALMGVPTFLLPAYYSSDDFTAGLNRHSMAVFIFGSAPLLGETTSSSKSAQVHVSERYGMTEDHMTAYGDGQCVPTLLSNPILCTESKAPPNQGGRASSEANGGLVTGYPRVSTRPIKDLRSRNRESTSAPRRHRRRRSALAKCCCSYWQMPEKIRRRTARELFSYRRFGV